MAERIVRLLIDDIDGRRFPMVAVSGEVLYPWRHLSECSRHARQENTEGIHRSELSHADTSSSIFRLRPELGHFA